MANTADTPGGAGPKTVRLLTVGNSFSGNACEYLGSLAKAGGKKLVWHQAGIPGGSIAQHLAKDAAFLKDSKDPDGRYSGSKLSLREELVAQPWDIITMQQASIKSHDLSTYRPHARELYEVIHSLAPKAEIMLHQTWAYRLDDARFASTNPPPGDPTSRQMMYEMLTRAYATIAAELNIKVIPVGDAFHLADADPVWAYRPDTNFVAATAVYPALPDQKHSLHVGYNWKQNETNHSRFLAMDCHHANTAGKYLGACVFYEVLFKDSVVGNRYIPKGLDRDFARFLQETAHKAVAQRACAP